MEKSTLLKAFGLLTLLFVFTACNRYEEGSNFSLITAKGRFVNTWSITKFEYTSGSTTQELDATGSLTVSKDGTYSENMTVTYPFIGAQTTSSTGTWVFTDDKKQVLATDSNGDMTTFNIVRLKNKELALTYVNNQDDMIRVDYQGN